MRKTRIHIAKLFTLIVALQILNMGFFAQDFQPLNSPTELSDENVINTIVEYVSEVVLNHKNAIPEIADQNDHNMQPHKHVDIKLITASDLGLNVQTIPSACAIKFPFIVNYSYQFCKEINPPPPKVVRYV